eukprot:6036990-Pleurochrysis_carterae.AAC.1
MSEAVVVQISPLLLSAKDDRTKREFAPHTGLSAVYIVLASLHFKQRVQAPSTNALKRLAHSVTRKEGGKGSVEKRAGGLLQAFCLFINQRRYDPEMSQLSAAEAKQQQLLRCDAVKFNGVSIFEAVSVSSSASPAATTKAAATAAG